MTTPAGKEFWWMQLDYVFELPPPADFPPLEQRLDERELAALTRYVEVAPNLENSSALTADSSFTVSFDQTGVEDVTSEFPPDELVRAVAPLFRQFYADEPASFERVMGILQKAARGASDAERGKRIEHLNAWHAASRALRGTFLERLVHEKMGGEGLMPPFPTEGPDGQPLKKHETPEEIISAFFYGEHLHWVPEKVEQLADWQADDFGKSWYLLRFLQAVSGLAHVYIGFAEVVKAAVGRAD